MSTNPQDDHSITGNGNPAEDVDVGFSVSFSTTNNEEENENNVTRSSYDHQIMTSSSTSHVQIPLSVIPPEVAMEEVIVKTEIDTTTLHDHSDLKPVLPLIPFSFPGQTFDVKCQKLILNVWDFFKRVKKNPDILDEITTPQERAAAALHISAATIGKIGKALKTTGKLETPGKKRKRSKPVVDSITPQDEETIRQIIQEIRNKKITPTLPLVLVEARLRINFTGGNTSFRRVLARMGYTNLSQKNVSRRATNSNAESHSHQHAHSEPEKSTGQSSTVSTLSTISLVKSETGVIPITITAPQTFTNISESNNADNNAEFTNDSSSSPIQNNNSNSSINASTTVAQTSESTLIASAPASVVNPGQTIYIQQLDNTFKPVQIIYTNKPQ